MAERETLEVRYYAVCLIDVLGQREWLRQWQQLPVSPQIPPPYVEALRRTAGVVLGLKEVFRSFFEGARLSTPDWYSMLDAEGRHSYNRFSDFHLSAQQFSDTIVCYAPVANAVDDVSIGPLYMALLACSATMLTFLAMRVPARGAVVVGTGMELADGNFYGPALAEAHGLETEAAKYPRVVVSPSACSFVEAIRQGQEQDLISKSMRRVADMCSSMIVFDGDGHAMVDFMGQAVHELARGDAEMEGCVRKAWQFVSQEQQRFQALGHAKLAGRYGRLQRYMVTRLPIWGGPPT